MIYYKKEGEELRNGFNFYPRKDKYNFGWRMKIGTFVWKVRYSKTLKCWLFNTYFL